MRVSLDLSCLVPVELLASPQRHVALAEDPLLQTAMDNEWMNEWIHKMTANQLKLDKDEESTPIDF